VFMTASGVMTGTGTLPAPFLMCASMQGSLTGPMSGDTGDWAGTCSRPGCSPPCCPAASL
jgi:hypothetical protein